MIFRLASSSKFRSKLPCDSSAQITVFAIQWLLVRDKSGCLRLRIHTAYALNIIIIIIIITNSNIIII